MTTAEAYLNGIDNLPALPEIAHKIVSLADEDAPNVNEVADLIQQDPAITVSILKIINSGYYTLRREVTNIRQAVVLLGLQQIRNLVVTMVTVNHFSDRPGARIKLADFWDHSLSVATIAQALGPKFGMEDKGDLYLCGLLHDVGKLIIQLYYPLDMLQIVRKIDEEHIGMYDAERAVLGFSHAELGQRLLKKWRFPEKFQDAVGCHHDCRQAKDKLFVAVVEFADMVAKSRLFAVYGDQYVDFTPADHRSWQVIRSELSARDDIDFARIFFEMDDEIEKARELVKQARNR